MKFRALCIAAATALAFCTSANATIIGSTYDFSASVTGSTQISPSGGPTVHTDPAGVGFCVGPPVACGVGSGVSGSYSFANVSPTLDTITFLFFGGTAGAGPGTFSIDLGNFVTLDDEVIKGVTYASGNLQSGDFSNVVFNGTDAIFTGSTPNDYSAIGGVSVVFNVATAAAPVPEPTSLALLGSGLLVLAGTTMRRRKAKA